MASTVMTIQTAVIPADDTAGVGQFRQPKEIVRAPSMAVSSRKTVQSERSVVSTVTPSSKPALGVTTAILVGIAGRTGLPPCRISYAILTVLVSAPSCGQARK